MSPTATIEPAGAGQAFRPTFSELLASASPGELLALARRLRASTPDQWSLCWRDPN